MNADGESHALLPSLAAESLDGTKEFLNRNGEFTVNIALMAAIDPQNPSFGARPVAGVVHAPVLGKTYFAADGLGAYVKGSDAVVERVTATEFSETDAGLTVVCSRSHMNDVTKQFVSKFAAPSTVSMGSSLKFMLIADGTAHVYPRLAPTSEWDTAASQIIVEEAGGVVLVHATGIPMRYNKPDILNPSFTVYGKRT
jgi:3'(2'), 5'-bisphosphate nucleotidase